MLYFSTFSILLLRYSFFFVGSFGFFPPPPSQKIIPLPCILQQNNIRVEKLFSQQQLSQSTNTNIVNTKGETADGAKEGSTVVRVDNPSNGMSCTLIGTAHLSKASKDQVREIITTIRPDAVLVELDPKGLVQHGYMESGEDLGIPFVTSEGIPPYETQQQQQPIQNYVLESACETIRQLFSKMNEEWKKKLNNNNNNNEDSLISGGEFKVAIDTARDIKECRRLILADDDYMTTLRRFAELSIRSGNVTEVLNRFDKLSNEEIRIATEEVEEESNEEMAESELTVKVIERLKLYKTITKLNKRLQQEVPEYYRAYIEERDYIMAECINREILQKQIDDKITIKRPKHVVAVVGAGHVPGIEEYLKQSWNNNNKATAQLSSSSGGNGFGTTTERKKKKTKK